MLLKVIHFPVSSMNRLNQTEPATFLILLCWAFFRDFVFLYFIKSTYFNAYSVLTYFAVLEERSRRKHEARTYLLICKEFQILSDINVS
jgi:hypothetical protein